MKKGIFMIFISTLFILISQNSNAITVINEIMYDPHGNYNNKEFVEVYSTDYNNLTNFTIEDSSGNDPDKLELIQYTNFNYFLIVENGFDYSGINVTIYSAGNAIGNGLKDEGDIIILRDNKGKIIDVVGYFNSFGADNNGRSLERISINGYSNNPSNWKESNFNGGTPGSNNSAIEIEFNDLKINEFLPDPKGNDDSNQPDGEWIEIYNSKDYNINLEGFVLEDNSGKRITISNTNTNSLTIKKKDFSVIYMNGASGFLNNDGFEKIKLLYGNKMIDEVTYADSKEDLSWQKINDLWKLLKPSPLKENVEEKEFDKSISNLEIIKVYTGNDNSLSFGDQFEARLEIYKGNTNKNSIDVWVENNGRKISKATNFNIYHKFVNYTLNVPLILDPNCDNEYKEGTYELIAEGLDLKDEENIEIEGFENKLCNKKEDVKEVKTSSANIPTETSVKDDEDMGELTIKSENKVQGNVVYESSDLKAKNASSYILIIALLLIIIIILFRKGL